MSDTAMFLPEDVHPLDFGSVPGVQAATVIASVTQPTRVRMRP